MAFTLRNNGVRYSPAEQKLFALLPRGRRNAILTTDLAHQLHGRRAPHGRAQVIGTAKSLLRKMRLNREPFRLRKTERSGPYPVFIWVEPHR